MERRRFLQMAGAGSVALLSGSSVAAAAPEVGKFYSLKCLGIAKGPRYLDGRTGNGTVGLAPALVRPFTGTKWKLWNGGYGTFVFECQDPGSRWLDGRTANGSVGLAPNTREPFSGTRWQIIEVEGGVTLKCLGKVDGPRWLDGRTGNGSVGLAKTTDPPFTGTKWELAFYPQCFDEPCPVP